LPHLTVEATGLSLKVIFLAVASIINRNAATLTPDIEMMIQHLLFQEWLGDKRQAASVEWYWG
jgi:hypothetical protein